MAEGLVGGGFAVAAGALLAVGPAAGILPWGTFALLAICFAVLARVRFDVGSGFTVPTQLLFVPMLFLLPAKSCPPRSRPGFVLAGVPEVVRRRQPFGPAGPAPRRLVVQRRPRAAARLHGGGGAAVDDWWLYSAALGAQLAGDFVASWVRDAVHGEAPSPREQLREARWIYTVDVLLSAVGLLAAFAAAGRPALVLLVLPLAALLSMFAAERRKRHRPRHRAEPGVPRNGARPRRRIEADDAYTGDHTRASSPSRSRSPQQMGLDAPGRQRVEFGALLHDVGKIAIPKSIINKPGPLDDDEWALIRTHTVEGQRLLDRVGGLMRDVGLVVRASHERWDGGGYPDGLAGEDDPARGADRRVLRRVQRDDDDAVVPRAMSSRPRSRSAAPARAPSSTRPSWTRSCGSSRPGSAA